MERRSYNPHSTNIENIKSLFEELHKIIINCKDTGYSGADGCQTNRERGVTTTTYSPLLVYLQIRTSIYTTFTQ